MPSGRRVMPGCDGLPVGHAGFGQASGGSCRARPGARRVMPGGQRVMPGCAGLPVGHAGLGRAASRSCRLFLTVMILALYIYANYV